MVFVVYSICYVIESKNGLAMDRMDAGRSSEKEIFAEKKQGQIVRLIGGF
jgi:hypothetical protein